VEYNTDDQPWDPISAVTCALVGDLGNIAMAVADFPREVFKGASGNKRNATTSTSTSSEAQLEGSGSTPIPEIRSDTATESSSQAGGSTDPVTTHASTTAAPPSEHTLSPQQTQTTQTSSNNVSRQSSRSRGQSPEPNPVTIETAVGAGKSVGRIAGAAMNTPMNFCLGLARGFRNAPKLYGDDVRETEKVTDFVSGLKVAGKEFGLGMFDGISGLVTQPLKGAEKEGAAGLLKGFGRGLGGVVLKPAAAVWSIPAYTMQGVHAEVRNLFKRSTVNYIITSRVVQGKDDLALSTAEEQRDILLRWQAKRDELKGYYLLKQREKKLAEQGETGAPKEDVSLMDGPPKTGWLHTRKLPYEERKKLHAQKEAWKNRMAGLRAPGRPATATTTSTGSGILEDEDFERAILASVQQTSRGDKEEDAKIEQSIRASVKEMRRIAEYSRDWKAPIPEPGAEGETGQGGAPISYEDLTNITDEEYQELIAKAVTQSLSQQAVEYQRRNDAFEDSDDDELRRAIEASRKEQHEDEDELLQRALEASRKYQPDAANDEEALLQQALEASEREHLEQLQRERNEEEIVLEYVKKQSLAEEEYRRQTRASDKGKGKEVEDTDDGDDEDLRRALEESMQMHGHGDGAGPSFSAAGRR
jgi:hypothetical protein